MVQKYIKEINTIGRVITALPFSAHMQIAAETVEKGIN
jgi:hypothetical protein